MTKAVRWDLSVLIQPAPDLPGQWLSHCLNFDVMSQGNSPSHARDMIIEAVGLTIADDLAAGRNPAEREPALQEEWELFERVIKLGKLSTVEQVDAASAGMLIAAPIHLALGVDAESEAHEPVVLPAWMIAKASPSDHPLGA